LRVLHTAIAYCKIFVALFIIERQGWLGIAMLLRTDYYNKRQQADKDLLPGYKKMKRRNKKADTKSAFHYFSNAAKALSRI
jgi:hypothetical protein